MSANATPIGTNCFSCPHEARRSTAPPPYLGANPMNATPDELKSSDARINKPRKRHGVNAHTQTNFGKGIRRCGHPVSDIPCRCQTSLGDLCREYERELAGNWKKFDSFGWHDQPDPKRFTLFNMATRDAGLLDESNMAVFERELCDYPGVTKGRSSHWACGYIDTLILRIKKKARRSIPLPRSTKHHEQKTKTNESSVCGAIRQSASLRSQLRSYPISQWRA